VTGRSWSAGSQGAG